MADSSSNSSSTRPWVERYRPKTLKDISHQTEIVATLQNATATGRLPHLLFYGPPGSGKTSVALALCRQLWHPSQWNRRVLELNASDERGISVVRDKIKHFASLTVGKGYDNNNNNNTNSKSNFFQKNMKSKENSNKKDDNDDTLMTDMGGDENKKNSNQQNHQTMKQQDGKEEEMKYPNPPFKIIILDEADTVTPDAQAALRRVIEAHSSITRFILICNYVTRIIEPLASRCAKFRFQPLPPESMKNRLLSIAQAEHFSPKEIELIDEVLIQADGDMRKAVTTLQSLHSIAVGGEDQVTVETIAEIAGLPSTVVIDTLWQSLTLPPSHIDAISTYDQMQHAVEDVCAAGYSAQSLLLALLPKLINDQPQNDGDSSNKKYGFSEVSKAKIAIRMAEAEKNMIEGADEYLQFLSVCSLILSCYQRGL